MADTMTPHELATEALRRVKLALDAVQAIPDCDNQRMNKKRNTTTRYLHTSVSNIERICQATWRKPEPVG